MCHNPFKPLETPPLWLDVEISKRVILNEKVISAVQNEHQNVFNVILMAFIYFFSSTNVKFI